MTSNADDRKRVLELLSQGKITVDEANQLLDTLGAAAEPPTGGAADGDTPQPKSRRWVRITIDKASRNDCPARQFSIRVPLAFAKSGVRFGAIFPHLAGPRVRERLREEGFDIDWSKIDFSKYETLLNDLGETTVDIDHGRAQVRISYE